MKRRWKILIGVGIVLAVLLVVNTFSVSNETKNAEVTIDGGQILELPSGDVQVFEEGPLNGDERAAPIVLLHCYGCSMHWYDRIAPILAEEHRVIRIDLLGFGGSEKPAAGYSIEEQAALVGAAMNRLDVEGAVVVGHSLGATVATALAEQSSELVDRVVNIDQAPDNSFGSLPFIAKLTYVPLIGPALWRLSPSFAVKDGYKSAFAPDFEISSGFPNPDQVVDDFRATTYTSYDESPAAEDDYTEEIPLDERMAETVVPLMVIFGSEDQIYDTQDALAAYEEGVPGVQTAEVPDAGHSPNVEKPEETAELILDFAARATPALPERGGSGKR